jgi:DNA repair protein RadC
MVVREMPQQERPRERMLKYGPAALSDVELLAIILRTGGSGFSVLDLARQLLAEYNGNIAALFRADIPHLLKVGGIGPTKATQLRAVFELSRRIHTFTPEKKALRSPAQAAAIFIPFFKGEEKEKLLLLCLDTKCRFSPGSQIVLSEGSINSSIIDTREIFKKALAHNAASIILLHNHPSGDPAPSREDIDVTRKVVEAGRLLQVPVNDHIIIGDGTYASLRELGYI